MLVSYRTKDSAPGWRAGIADQQRVVAISGSVRQLLEQGPAALEQAFAAARRQLDGNQDVLEQNTLELGPPVPDPDKILCLGLNYGDHAAEAQEALPSVPMFFAKFRNSLTGPKSPVILPRVSDQIDYEGELAVVIGQRCKEVSEAEALAFVAGYTIINDVSARDVQMQTSQWMAGKALDTFAPMGPGLVPAWQLPDPQHLQITTRVNGIIVQQDHTGHMIFSVAQSIAFLSTLMTLEPGDIIATGTPSGVGFKRTPPLYLKDGDVAEVEIEGIGKISNPFTRRQADHTSAPSVRRAVTPPLPLQGDSR